MKTQTMTAKRACEAVARGPLPARVALTAYDWRGICSFSCKWRDTEAAQPLRNELLKPGRRAADACPETADHAPHAA